MSTVDRITEDGLIEAEILVSLIVASILLTVFANSLRQQLELIKHTQELSSEYQCVEVNSLYNWCNGLTQRRLQFKASIR